MIINLKIINFCIDIFICSLMLGMLLFNFFFKLWQDFFHLLLFLFLFFLFIPEKLILQFSDDLFLCKRSINIMNELGIFWTVDFVYFMSVECFLNLQCQKFYQLNLINGTWYKRYLIVLIHNLRNTV